METGPSTTDLSTEQRNLVRISEVCRERYKGRVGKITQKHLNEFSVVCTKEP